MPASLPRNLVTGGAGFVGSHLVDRLMEAGEEVICLDNTFTGRKANVRQWWDHPRFEFIRHDVTEPIRLEVDRIWHLACPASPVHYQHNPIKTAKTSFLGTYNMLGLARRVAIVGEVERPGVYTLTTSEQSQTEAAVAITGLPTLVDAIQKAGGLAAQADLRQVVLQRRLPGEQAQFKRARVNLLALVRDGDLQQNPLLFDGDTIRVLKAEETATEAIEISSTTLSPTTITVNVVGEVKTPGRIQLPANTPLVQAVLAAGGPEAWRASTGNVELVRINRNGTATRERFKLNYGADASTDKNPPLRDGDTVVVNRSSLARTSDAIGAVANPISGLVNIWALVDLIQR